MNCVICKQGQTYLGTTTVTLEREGAIACLGGARIAQLSSTGKPVDFCFRIVVQKSDEIRMFRRWDNG